VAGADIFYLPAFSMDVVTRWVEVWDGGGLILRRTGAASDGSPRDSACMRGRSPHCARSKRCHRSPLPATGAALLTHRWLPPAAAILRSLHGAGNLFLPHIHRWRPFLPFAYCIHTRAFSPFTKAYHFSPAICGITLWLSGDAYWKDLPATFVTCKSCFFRMPARSTCHTCSLLCGALARGLPFCLAAGTRLLRLFTVACLYSASICGLPFFSVANVAAARCWRFSFYLRRSLVVADGTEPENGDLERRTWRMGYHLYADALVTLPRRRVRSSSD